MVKNVYPQVVHTDPSKLKLKDYQSDQDVRWCPGCGDYSILANVQRFMPSLGIPKENFVFVSGIGCSSRFPYYMNTFGIHTIHGRAPAVATGIKASRPDLSVWVITGDGDALSIGGNHFLHVLRRNVDIKYMLFNNRIYGLTKGQYSPTSEFGKKTKSTPMGSIDYPIDPVSMALGAGATFVARAVDIDAQGFQQVLASAATHKGTAFIEIYQNCNIFNDGAFLQIQEKKTRPQHALYLQHGKPMIYGDKGNELGIQLDAQGQPQVVKVADVGEDKLLVHDETSDTLPFVISRLKPPHFPTPLGVIRKVQLPSYDELLNEQIEASKPKRKTVQELLNAGETWTVG
ncbi:MAG TPA: 2-oxoacid:ferredoxin oxidoreductase subunit beta [Polyangiales bacterium]|nr:2-oxoacid:ferredoxin oxidoreductase subunit beta [Polyangiales bacterium]